MSLESFLAYFYKEYNEINDQLASLVKIENTENEQEEKLKLSSIYESVSNRTEILQKYFTDNTPFSPQYEIRKAQDFIVFFLIYFVQMKLFLIIENYKNS